MPKPSAIQEIFVCRIPDLCGYGVEAYGSTQKEAETLAKRKFCEMRREWNVTHEWASSFERAMAYFSGTTVKIILPAVGHSNQCGTRVDSFGG